MKDLELEAEVPGKKRSAVHQDRLRGGCLSENGTPSERTSLKLQRVHLRPSERWTSWNTGLFFLIVEEGSGFWTSCNSARGLNRGELLVQGCGEAGELQAGRSELSCSFFSVAAENLFPLFSDQEIPSFLSIISHFNRPKVYSASDPLTQSCYELLKQTPSQPRLAQRIRLLQMVVTLLAPQFELGSCSNAASGRRVDEQVVRQFEKLSITELLTLSVSDLSEKFNCSRRHLNRLFNEHFGLSVATLKMEMRLLKAASLLRDPEMKIIHVAEECGFNHLGLFNTCFKRRFGSTPGRWRKQDLPVNRPSAAHADVAPVCALRANGLCTGMLEGFADVAPFMGLGTAQDHGSRDLRA